MKRYGLAVQNELVEQALSEANLISAATSVIRSHEELKAVDLDTLGLDYLFFPHWSHIVPARIHENLACICFHAAPLPYGRGGSPIQNMIRQGHDTTEICALLMTGEIDAGPVYLRQKFSLSGSGRDLFNRLYHEIAAMIGEMLLRDYTPVDQTGEITIFKRLDPKDNRLPEQGTARTLYDHIRMTDTSLYPSAWLDHGDWILEFSDPVLDHNEVSAKVVFKKRTESG